MRTFIATFDWRGGRGAYDEITSVVIANTKEEALGLVLEEHKTTQARYWSVEEVDTTKLSVTNVHEACS